MTDVYARLRERRAAEPRPFATSYFKPSGPCSPRTCTCFPGTCSLGSWSRCIGRRQAICAEREIGLTTLYNEVEDGAYDDLAALHRQLDEAVVRAYGWPATAAHDTDDCNRRLLELNGRIHRGELAYAPSGAAGAAS